HTSSSPPPPTNNKTPPMQKRTVLPGTRLHARAVYAVYFFHATFLVHPQSRDPSRSRHRVRARILGAHGRNRCRKIHSARRPQARAGGERQNRPDPPGGGQ